MAAETFILNPIFIKNVVKKLLVEWRYKKTTSCPIKYATPWKMMPPPHQIYKRFQEFFVGNHFVGQIPWISTA